MQKITLPQALLASVILIVVGGLFLADKDSSAFIGAAIAGLGAIGYVVKGQAETQQVAVQARDNTNGNTKELLAIITSQQAQIMELSHKLADSTPAPR